MNKTCKLADCWVPSGAAQGLLWGSHQGLDVCPEAGSRPTFSQQGSEKGNCVTGG